MSLISSPYPTWGHVARSGVGWREATDVSDYIESGYDMVARRYEFYFQVVKTAFASE